MQLSVDILILGAGWTSTFLIPLCTSRSVTFAATTRDGRDDTIPFAFDPDAQPDERELEKWKVLPDARTVVVTFPMMKSGAGQRLVEMYVKSRASNSKDAAFVALGSTGIWDGQRKAGNDASASKVPKAVENKWYDRHSPIVPGDRALAEEEFLKLNPEYRTTVLNLAGLWGGARQTRNWVGRVAPTKEALRNKGSIHMIHGLDVSRAILAVHASFDKAQGQRWILTDGRVYDWWDLASAWGVPPKQGEDAGKDAERGPHARWVRELMEETGVRALPRDIGVLGRAMDSRDFWTTFGLSPVKARLEN